MNELIEKDNAVGRLMVVIMEGISLADRDASGKKQDV